MENLCEYISLIVAIRIKFLNILFVKEKKNVLNSVRSVISYVKFYLKDGVLNILDVKKQVN